MAPLLVSMTFVFLGNLGLRLTCISKRGVVGLCFVLIFVFIPVLLIAFIFFLS